MLALVGAGPLALKDPRMIYRSLARMCERAAKLERLDLEKLKYEDTYALLGISEDGSVMALSWRDDAWLPTRAPVPSLVAHAKELGLVRLNKQVALQPVWARVTPQKLHVFRNGKEVEIWRTPALARPAVKAEPPEPKPAVLEQEIGKGNFKDVVKPVDVIPPDPEIPNDIREPDNDIGGP